MVVAETTTKNFLDRFLKPNEPENEQAAIQAIVDSLEKDGRLNLTDWDEEDRYPHLIELIQAAWKGTKLLARHISYKYETSNRLRITPNIVGYKHRPDVPGRDVTEYDIPEFIQPQVHEDTGIRINSGKSISEIADEVPQLYPAKICYSDAAIVVEDMTNDADDTLPMGLDEPFPVGDDKKHLFTVLAVANSVRFIRWDRSGVVVTQPVDFIEDLTTFITFFYRFARMDDGDRGVDGTVIKASAEDEHVLEAFRTEQFPSLVKSHKYMFKEAFDLEGVEEQDWPLMKIEVKKLDETDSNTRAAQVPPPENATDPPSNLSSTGSTSKSIRLLIRYPRVSSRSHCGRATKGFVALDMDEMKLKFLKDCWRYDDDRYFHPELEVYKKLGATNVKNIAKVEGGGDVVDEQLPTNISAHGAQTISL